MHNMGVVVHANYNTVQISLVVIWNGPVQYLWNLKHLLGFLAGLYRYTMSPVWKLL